MRKWNWAIIVRILLILIPLMIQAASMIVISVYFSRIYAYYYALCVAISIVVTLYIVRRDSVPEYKIAWIIPILILPIFGGLFYLFFGRVKPTHKEKRQIDVIRRRCDEAMLTPQHTANAESDASCLYRLDPGAAAQSRYICTTAGIPPYAGTNAEYFSLGDDMFRRMLEDLEKAERFIFMEYFIIRKGRMWDAVLEVLTRKAHEGLDVRLMYDDFGCMFQLPPHYVRELESKGIKCCVFNKFSSFFVARFNNRNHRKICIIDGNIGYTGGVNIADEYINLKDRFGHWKDSAVRLEGRGVWGLTVMFLSLWCYIRGMDENFLRFAPSFYVGDDGFVQPFTDIPLDDDPVGEMVYINMLSRARKYVYITTPYLVIDSAMKAALTGAAKSGIDVRIITPGIPDKRAVFFLTRSYYPALIKAGVRIFEYTPGFIHAKNFVSDDTTAVIGTINLDFRSLYLHYECAVWMYGSSAVSDVRDDFLKTQEMCREITADDIAPLPLHKRLMLGILRLFSPLM